MINDPAARQTWAIGFLEWIGCSSKNGASFRLRDGLQTGDLPPRWQTAVKIVDFHGKVFSLDGTFENQASGGYGKTETGHSSFS